MSEREDTEATNGNAGGRLDAGENGEGSVLKECYWVVCGQFEGSEAVEDEIKSSVIAMAIATGVLSFAAATVALLASGRNWPVAVTLFVVGVVVLALAWFTGLHRLDRVLIST